MEAERTTDPLEDSPRVQAPTSDDGPRMTVLTPPGRGAIGVIRVWGQGTIEALEAVFRPARGKRLAETPAGRLRLGRIGQGLGDEVVAVRLPDGPVAAAEIQCHGGAAATNLVLDALRDAGVALVDPSHWTRDVAPSRITAQALEDLARAPTLRTAEILLEQAQGTLSQEIREVIQAIPRGDAVATEALGRLLDNAQVGLRLLSGWKVVIVGRPNVGKSRLLNALAGYQRAIVHATPGTTRDVLTVTTALDGWPIELVDTAGVRQTDDPVEGSGIIRARQQADASDLVLAVLDRSEPLRDEDRDLIARPGRALVVANKNDLPAAWPLDDPALGGGRILSVSAEHGDGLDELISAVVTALVPRSPAPGAGVPFREAHRDALEQARQLLDIGDVEAAMRWLQELLA